MLYIVFLHSMKPANLSIGDIKACHNAGKGKLLVSQKFFWAEFVFDSVRSSMRWGGFESVRSVSHVGDAVAKSVNPILQKIRRFWFYDTNRRFWSRDFWGPWSEIEMVSSTVHLTCERADQADLRLHSTQKRAPNGFRFLWDPKRERGYYETQRESSVPP